MAKCHGHNRFKDLASGIRTCRGATGYKADVIIVRVDRGKKVRRYYDISRRSWVRVNKVNIPVTATVRLRLYDQKGAISGKEIARLVFGPSGLSALSVESAILSGSIVASALSNLANRRTTIGGRGMIAPHRVQCPTCGHRMGYVCGS